jgi:DNA-binding transcriptional ArsR family regulator
MSDANTRGSVGNFFAIDRRTFARVCELGMNAIVAYLVMGCGSERQNLLTAWSVNAIERYTGISRSRARIAIEALTGAKIVRVIQQGTHPFYELPRAREIPGTLAYPRPDLDVLEQEIVEKVRQGRSIPRKDKIFALGAVKKGWLIQASSGEYELTPEPNPEPEWIWLPNELVIGAAREVPPLELVRQTQDPMTLRLLVDLYHVQNLRDDGGINRQVVWKKFDRVQVGQRGEFDVWGFRPGLIWVSWKEPTLLHRRDDLPEGERGQDLFNRIDRLRDLGLIEWLPHLFESDLPDAEVIHVYGTGYTTGLEDRLGAAAHAAGRSMVTDGQYRHACGYGADAVPLWLAPVRRHMANVQMIGVARLRYRPRTALTEAWWAELNNKGERFIENYNKLIVPMGKERAI